jgi:hypothetical protein
MKKTLTDKWQLFENDGRTIHCSMTFVLWIKKVVSADEFERFISQKFEGKEVNEFVLDYQLKNKF